MLINAHSPALVTKPNANNSLKTAGLFVTWVALNAICFSVIANQLQKKYELIGQRVIFVDRNYRWQGTYTSLDFGMESTAIGVASIAVIPVLTSRILETMFGSPILSI